MKHLKYCFYAARDSKVSGNPQAVMYHPQAVMEELGITYQHATPQSISDQWWFWNCENLPNNLPEFLSDLKISDPMEYVGRGLSKETAEKIRDYEPKKS